MLKFEWNALRFDEPVLVHDRSSADLALVPGVVVMVDTHRGHNGVGIRITAEGGDTNMVWPSYFEVHRDPREPNVACWRCDALALSKMDAPE